jgi:hypothetical protein
MKKILILISVVALVAFVLSCSQQVEPTAQFPKSTTALTVTSSLASVTATAKDSLSPVVSFTWNDPKFSLGLSQTMFTVVLSPTGTNFAKFTTKSFTGVLTGSLLGKELNGMALKLGGVIGQAITLDAKVVASLSNNTEPVNSNVLQVSVSPYGDLALVSSVTKINTSAANSLNVGAVFTWNTAFNGYSGVKTYQFQYAVHAVTGTSFANPTTTTVTGFSQSFTQNELNNIALGYGTAVGSAGYVDFRVKATDEQGTVLYSNAVTDTIGTYAPYNSIGIIGDATPGGWNTDVDLYRPDPVNSPTNWTVVVYLIGGNSAKFRADDAWVTSWGAATWPSAPSSTTNNAPNIPVSGASGYYQVNFSSATGAYSFTQVTVPTYTNISVIGTSPPGVNWTTDTELNQLTPGGVVWADTVTLVAGQLKFRANNAWTTSWGVSTSSPTGLSGWGTTNNGANITIATAGKYYVYINVATGEYFFGSTANNAETSFGQIGIIGDGTPGGWNTDTYLIQDPANPYKWSAKVPLTAASAKFRANTDWTINWGNTSFPNGIGTENGANIPVTAGNPQITFNSATGEYSFSY